MMDSGGLWGTLGVVVTFLLTFGLSMVDRRSRLGTISIRCSETMSMSHPSVDPDSLKCLASLTSCPTRRLLAKINE